MLVTPGGERLKNLPSYSFAIGVKCIYTRSPLTFLYYISNKFFSNLSN